MRDAVTRSGLRAATGYLHTLPEMPADGAIAVPCKAWCTAGNQKHARPFPGRWQGISI
jgi:hypothetical protein